MSVALFPIYAAVQIAFLLLCAKIYRSGWRGFAMGLAAANAGVQGVIFFVV